MQTQKIASWHAVETKVAFDNVRIIKDAINLRLNKSLNIKAESFIRRWSQRSKKAPWASQSQSHS